MSWRLLIAHGAVRTRCILTCFAVVEKNPVGYSLLLCHLYRRTLTIAAVVINRYDDDDQEYAYHNDATYDDDDDAWKGPAPAPGRNQLENAVWYAKDGSDASFSKVQHGDHLQQPSAFAPRAAPNGAGARQWHIAAWDQLKHAGWNEPCNRQVSRLSHLYPRVPAARLQECASRQTRGSCVLWSCQIRILAPT